MPVSAQAECKPSVPQFRVRIVGDYHYVWPSTTTTFDPYTRKENITTTPAHYTDERRIVVSIKNQPFTSYTDTDGKKYELYYKVQRNGPISNDWVLFAPTTFQSDSEYTTIVPDDSSFYFMGGTQIDFKVEAIFGHESFDTSTFHENVSWIHAEGDVYMFLDVATSDWSDVLTFTIPKLELPYMSPPSQTSALPPRPSSTTIPDDTGNQQQTQPPNFIFTKPFFLLGVGGALFAGVVITVVLVVLRRQIKTPTYTKDSTQTNTNTKP